MTNVNIDQYPTVFALPVALPPRTGLASALLVPRAHPPPQPRWPPSAGLEDERMVMNGATRHVLCWILGKQMRLEKKSC